MRRFYGAGGIPYFSADDVFTTNPQGGKRILVTPSDNHDSFFVRRGWIVMAGSGQTYGLNGAAALMTEWHEGKFLSDDLIRIVVKEADVRAGYVQVALTHRTHGRPLLIRAAYGTSIPHLDPADVADFPLARLGANVEAAIADLAERSAAAQAEAELVERKMAADAGEIIDGIMGRPPLRLVTTDTAGGEAFRSLADQRRAERPRGADLSAMTDTPAYKAIIGLGERAVPLLLAELARKPDHWFPALHAITGENPVPPEAEGKLKLMAAAWLQWGNERGYAGGDLD